MLNGLLARKLGMTQVFAPDGTLVPVTVLEAGPCYVVQRKTKEKDGDKVNITGKSKAKGFTGVIKRHGFGRGPMSHGSRFHRFTGSIGTSATPGRVMKGRKMPGHAGNRTVTIRNLEIVEIIPEKNLLLVKGAVPGAVRSLVVVRKK